MNHPTGATAPIATVRAQMRRFSIRLRMQGAIAMVMALFALVGATALWGGAELTRLNRAFAEQTLAQTRVAAATRLALVEARRAEKDVLIQYEKPEAIGPLRQRWQTHLEAARQGLAQLAEGRDQAHAAGLLQAQKNLRAYGERASQVMGQVQEGAYENARVADRMLDAAKAQVGQVEQALAQVDQEIQQAGQEALAHFEARKQLLVAVFAAVMALVALVVVPLTLLNSHSITGPIGQARAAALAIAEGKLTQRLDTEGSDEAADLMRALQHMQASLAGLVREVRETSGDIQRTSHQVAAGNTDLSSRTDQAASNLQQTASAMHQVTQSVQHSADSAGSAHRLATSASEVAERGGQVVADVVRTMDKIHDASRQIADIIGTIDGIAFQTNILALNAAVEAARAGEQGRGFAVVAGEVRSLAQRSAEAAREIKQLIQASVEQVEGGSRLVNDAGSTMGDIVASVQQVQQTLAGITHAADEQSKGIVQVNGAVDQLDQVTRQNAALVQQSAQSAESLRGQAERLNGLVDRFQLEA